MAVRKPLVIIGGQTQELPTGDTIVADQGTLWYPVSVKNNGAPELLFHATGEVVSTNVAF